MNKEIKLTTNPPIFSDEQAYLILVNHKISNYGGSVLFSFPAESVNAALDYVVRELNKKIDPKILEQVEIGDRLDEQQMIRV